MSSKKKSRALEESSDDSSDSGPSDRNPQPSKKAKTEKKSSTGNKTEDGSIQFQLSKMRYVNVREFRGKVMVDIREFYEKDGNLMPGRKGISLNMEQWNALKGHLDDINEAIKQF